MHPLKRNLRRSSIADLKKRDNLSINSISEDKR